MEFAGPDRLSCGNRRIENPGRQAIRSAIVTAVADQSPGSYVKTAGLLVVAGSSAGARALMCVVEVTCADTGLRHVHDVGASQ